MAFDMVAPDSSDYAPITREAGGVTTVADRLMLGIAPVGLFAVATEACTVNRRFNVERWW